MHLDITVPGDGRNIIEEKEKWKTVMRRPRNAGIYVTRENRIMTGKLTINVGMSHRVHERGLNVSMSVQINQKRRRPGRAQANVRAWTDQPQDVVHQAELQGGMALVAQSNPCYQEPLSLFARAAERQGSLLACGYSWQLLKTRRWVVGVGC